MTGSRFRATVGLAVATLRHYRVLTVLAIGGVALAVLFTVVLVSLGTSVVVGGEAEIERIGGDLWATAGPTTFAPGAIGQVDHSIPSAHPLTREIADRDDVLAARAFAFQTVYVGSEPDEFETITAVGVTGDGSIFSTTEGSTFSGGDTHYAGGTYDGPMSGEVLLDRRAAEQLDVSVGDTLHVGGTHVAATEHTVTVVGISNDIARLSGTPTVILHLGELQQLSGSTGSDPATAIIIAVDDADPEVVRGELAATYPELTVRTNHEQFEAVLQRQSIVLASATTFVVLGLGSGIAIVANVIGLLVANQRRQLATCKATGMSSVTLVGIVAGQGIVVSLVGAGVGLVASVPVIAGLNIAVAALVGFEQLVTMPAWIVPASGLAAVGVSILGASVGGWLIVRTDPTDHLSH